MLAGPVLGQAPPPAANSAAVRDLMTNRSRSIHFEVSGTNRIVNMKTLKWAEVLTDRLERLLGLDMSFVDRCITIVIREAPDASAGRIETRESLQEGRLIQMLILYDPDRVETDAAAEALCSLLLTGHISASGAPRSDRQVLVESELRPRIPRWLLAGVAQNLYPEYKERNSQFCFELWSTGELPTAAEILHGKGALALDRRVCGVFVGWIRSWPQRAECFGGLLRMIAEGRTIERDALVPFAPGCAAAGDLEDAWDRWLLRQKHVVLTPGVTSAAAVDRLRAELLLYPGVSGIPALNDLRQPLCLGDMIERRDADWVPGFAAAKSMRLRMMAAGRGREFQEIVAAYCGFLDALAARKKVSALRSLLAAAERKRLEWEAAFKSSGPLHAESGLQSGAGDSNENMPDNGGPD